MIFVKQNLFLYFRKLCVCVVVDFADTTMTNDYADIEGQFLKPLSDFKDTVSKKSTWVGLLIQFWKVYNEGLPNDKITSVRSHWHTIFEFCNQIFSLKRKSSQNHFIVLVRGLSKAFWVKKIEVEKNLLMQS